MPWIETVAYEDADAKLKLLYEGHEKQKNFQLRLQMHLI